MCEIVSLGYGYEEWQSRETWRFGGLVSGSNISAVPDLVQTLLEAGEPFDAWVMRLDKRDECYRLAERIRSDALRPGRNFLADHIWGNRDAVGLIRTRRLDLLEGLLASYALCHKGILRDNTQTNVFPDRTEWPADAALEPGQVFVFFWHDGEPLFVLRREVPLLPDPKYARRLADARAWFDSLPEGTAEMKLTEEDDGTTVRIRPLRSPDGAPIWIHIDKTSGFVTLGAGGVFWVDDTFWESDIPIGAVCRAIASGGLREEIKLWRGRKTGADAALRVEGEARTVPTGRTRTYTLRGALVRLLLGAVFGGKGKRSIRYPPY